MKSSINYTDAIRKGIITFEQAYALQALADGAAVADIADAPKVETVKADAPKAETRKRKTRKTRKAETPKAETPKADAPKVETPKAEFSYTDGGAVIQYAAHNTIKANNMRRINNAIRALVEQGFCVSWKRVGHWVYIYHDRKADKRTSAEFKAAKVAAGWKFIKGAWVDTDMLKDYDDNFKPEK